MVVIYVTKCGVVCCIAGDNRKALQGGSIVQRPNAIKQPGSGGHKRKADQKGRRANTVLKAGRGLEV